MESYYAHPRIRSVRTFAVKTTIRIVVYYEKNNAIFGHGPLQGSELIDPLTAILLLTTTLPCRIVVPQNSIFQKFATRFPTIPTPPNYDFGRENSTNPTNHSQFFQIHAYFG